MIASANFILTKFKMEMSARLHTLGVSADEESSSQNLVRVSDKTSSQTVYQFPITKEPNIATVKDRPRNSGLTSVGFVNNEQFVCCDFNEKKAYFAEVIKGELAILDSHPTVISDGSPVQTDLIDVRGKEFVVSNFFQGSVSYYHINEQKIEFIKEINHNSYRNLHGVRFIPGYDDLLWLTYCGINNKCHQIINMKSEKVVHQFFTEQQCQDVAYNGKYAVVFARTNHMTGVGSKRPENAPIMFASAYIYEMPNDLLKKAPVLKRQWRGEGHIDAVKAGPDGRIYAANQYLDRVDVFELSSSGSMHLVEVIEGYGLPHGLDVNTNRLVVTCYEDTTLREIPL